MKKQPIGIFDSGVGGLTVFKEIRKRFPHEDICYFGDTARVPYGPKSRETVMEYSIQNARFLTQLGAKIIIVACNTSSSVAIENLRETLHIPVIGVIEPGAIEAVKTSTNGNIGIIGTEGTIRSDAYRKEILKRDPSVNVVSMTCPLFVSLVEEGWENHKITELVIEEYLGSMRNNNIDTLVLGCTHYPILKKKIGNYMGNHVKLVDSAETISFQLNNILPEPETSSQGKDFFYVSDNEEKFQQIASRILHREITSLVKVKTGESWYIDNE